MTTREEGTLICHSIGALLIYCSGGRGVSGGLGEGDNKETDQPAAKGGTKWRKGERTPRLLNQVVGRKRPMGQEGGQAVT